jgi:hypothetical protein
LGRGGSATHHRTGTGQMWPMNRFRILLSGGWGKCRSWGCPKEEPINMQLPCITPVRNAPLKRYEQYTEAHGFDVSPPPQEKRKVHLVASTDYVSAPKNNNVREFSLVTQRYSNDWREQRPFARGIVGLVAISASTGPRPSV